MRMTALGRKLAQDGPCVQAARGMACRAAAHRVAQPRSPPLTAPQPFAPGLNHRNAFTTSRNTGGKSSRLVPLRTVGADDAGMRLDSWLRRHLPHSAVTQGALHKLARKGGLRLSGRRAKPGDRVSVGDEVAVFASARSMFGALDAHAGRAARIDPRGGGGAHGGGARGDGRPGRAQKAPTKRERALVDGFMADGRVLFMDDHLLIINKPAGMPSQGGSGVKPGSSAVDMVKSMTLGGGEAPRLVHRLDRDTSGCLIFGRSRRAAEWVSKLLRDPVEHGVQKTYAAAVWSAGMHDPAPHLAAQGKRSVLHVALERVDDGGARGAAKGEARVRSLAMATAAAKDVAYEMAVANARRADPPAHTVTETMWPRIRGVNEQLGAAWVVLRPVTGHKHQLRVFCADVLGAPIVGDAVYDGGADSEAAVAWLLNQTASPQRLLGDDAQGGPAWPGGRLQQLHLHARRIRLPHPMDHSVTVDVSAPYPPHMVDAWRAIMPEGTPLT